ncbi:hypothetical protein DXH95_02990 [Sphingorhabdus pulchriflava]|uniref:Uncharacterized protein n=1 Tax=Sphingorhabdus pulchriflava TaxID=2292257 RepID=A0A371BFX9_9SPHN|nr:hypothetical protein [Sphingorhabdus pulchriflava]RDV06407.1 hypothetical protein DXH95_02990 [Sphingorhabdus pulchriflava]
MMMPDTAAEQQAERFGMVLALTPVLAGFEALVASDKSDADGDEPSHLIEATEVKLWLRRLNERLAMIGQGMHLIDPPEANEEKEGRD